MQDKALTCLECGNEFILSSDEQEFYDERGFEEPKRCRPCRQKPRRERSERTSDHGNNRW